MRARKGTIRTARPGRRCSIRSPPTPCPSVRPSGKGRRLPYRCGRRDGGARKREAQSSRPNRQPVAGRSAPGRLWTCVDLCRRVPTCRPADANKAPRRVSCRARPNGLYSSTAVYVQTAGSSLARRPVLSRPVRETAAPDRESRVHGEGNGFRSMREGRGGKGSPQVVSRSISGRDLWKWA